MSLFREKRASFVCVCATGQLSGAADPNALESGRPFLGATLDEPVRETVMRDLRNIGNKLLYVLKPSHMRNTAGAAQAGLRQWDLLGPLFLCLFLSVILYVQASWAPLPGTSESAPSSSTQLALRRERQRVAFSLVYVFVSLGASIVTVNAKLLGSKLSFFQSVCVLGYCLFPLDIAALLNIFVSRSFTFLKLLIAFTALRWSAGASVAFMAEMLPEEKRALGVFPVWLFYAGMAWIICSV
ncbi:Yip1 domain-containing protein [Besnoitia besnoiti]|uniref:Protein YIPF n=1 Tax=Besnoitia besnoiti TaxID=94643 RepID=A0A2A9M7Y2_BESBE|nr:Yip1 domain-containing protein [Besnoitia besnoiti]PFH31500.1 Yip1 domain-containing protein [Besnoitia besnoiti]